MTKWALKFSYDFEKSLNKFDVATQKRIFTFLNQKVLNHPDPVQLAKSLQGKFKGLHRFRVGDFRILVEIKRDVLIIIAIDVKHRREVYH